MTNKVIIVYSQNLKADTVMQLTLADLGLKKEHTLVRNAHRLLTQKEACRNTKKKNIDVNWDCCENGEGKNH